MVISNRFDGGSCALLLFGWVVVKMDERASLHRLDLLSIEPGIPFLPPGPMREALPLSVWCASA